MWSIDVNLRLPKTVAFVVYVDIAVVVVVFDIVIVVVVALLVVTGHIIFSGQ